MFILSNVCQVIGISIKLNTYGYLTECRICYLKYKKNIDQFLGVMDLGKITNRKLFTLLKLVIEIEYFK